MDAATARTYRDAIGRELRALRQARRWTQSELARRLGMTQSWLSRIEKGDASLSAEQLLHAARIFNAGLDRFLPRARGPASARIQNALARLGASHLHETEDALPTERLSEAGSVIQEVLATPPSPRHVSALAPVVVEQISHLNLSHLRGRCAETGLERRLGWALDNAKRALELELGPGASLPGRVRVKYQRALNHLSLPHVSPPPATSAEDIFDADIASRETLKEARKVRSDISRKWRLLTFLQPEDFRSALRQVYGRD